MVHSKFEEQTKKAMLETARKFDANLPGMGGFSMDIKWELATLLPLPARIRPEDLVTMHKKGNKIRINFALKDFDLTSFKWERGDMTLLLDIHTDEKKFCVFRTEEISAQQLMAEKKCQNIISMPHNWSSRGQKPC
ncbi:hypothetical protein niasHS_011184 [Heterodera schachtii]|uniref:Uncharacterized protein n=1 Tax=Heterodera schachtii TaxID=97005 RepID=A0ABD2IW71_HETSC